MPKVRTAILVGVFTVGTGLFLPVYSREVYYCVQLLSTTKLTQELERDFFFLKGFPERRVEKIGNLYTLRVGFWKSKREARKYLNLLKKRFPEAFIRTCYKLPSRWIFPKKRNTRGKSRIKVKEISRKEQVEIQFRKESLSVNYGKAAKEHYSSYTPISLEFKTFEFPQTRVKRKKSTLFSVGFSAANPLYSDNFYRIALFLSKNRPSLGISLLKKEKWRLRPYVSRFLLLDKTLDSPTGFGLKLGILSRKEMYENLSAPAVSLYWNAFPFSGEFTAGFAVKNGYNDVDLRNLLFSSFYSSYRFLPHLTVSGGILFENLVRREVDFYPFKSRSYFFSSVNYRKLNLSIVSSSRGGYLANLSFRLGNFELGFSSDKNLPMPLASKGHLYTERERDYVFVPDPLNLQRISLKYFGGKAGLSVNYYRLNGGKAILGSNYFSFKERGTLGVSVGGFYSFSLKNLYFNFYGGFFFPGAPFSDKTFRSGGGINLRGSW